MVDHGTGCTFPDFSSNTDRLTTDLSESPSGNSLQSTAAGYQLETHNGRVQPNGEPPVRMNEMIKKFSNLNLGSNSPIHLVNDIMLANKKRVQYNLVSITGQPHCQNFTIVAKCDNIVAYGNGWTKKEAKKNAATAFLDQLNNVNINNNITSTTLSTASNSIIGHEKNVLEDKSATNPVGALQELCMARHWQLPEYEIVKNELAHYYVVMCSIQVHSTRGEGRTKQEAKQRAASLMYSKITNLSEEVHEFDVPNTIPQNKTEFTHNIKTLLAKLNITNTQSYVDQFFDQLKLSKNPCINNLQKFSSISEFMTSSVNVLNNIGDEEGFDVKYIKIANKSATSEVLVEVSIIPFLVNVGTGKTMEEAQEMAAYSALLYLKLLLDK